MFRNKGRFGGGGGGLQPRDRENLDSLGSIVRDQLQILRSIQKEEDDFADDLDEIMTKVAALETIKDAPSNKMVIDLAFMTKCYCLVVFANPSALAKLFIIGRDIMKQKITRTAYPIVTMNLQIEYLLAFMICLQQHVKYIKQLKMNSRVAVIDSTMGISENVNRYAAPIANQYEEQIKNSSIKSRNEKLGIKNKKEKIDNTQSGNEGAPKL